MVKKNIQLSICIPAYNRPVGLKRALKSIVEQQEIDVKAIEIIISDDSTIPTCKQITTEMLENWPGPWKYINNTPRLGMAKNWNQSIKKASGEYILVLHDDDYLEQNGIYSILQGINSRITENNVFLFGVNVVDSNQKILKKQLFRRVKYLPPSKAIKAILSNSSFVRFPGIVIPRIFFIHNNYFDSTIGGVADLEMWIRLFIKNGVWCFPQTIAAYTVHTSALTMQMFNADSISKITQLFNRVRKEDIFSEDEIRIFQSKFIHQFILAGTFRKIRRSQWKEAKEIMNLFRDSNVTSLPFCIKWYLPKKIFSLIIEVYPYFFRIKS